jgi:hypothetical protein
MSLSRRALFPAAAGGILAAPAAAKQAAQYLGEAKMLGPPSPPDAYGMPQSDPNWRPRKVASLLEQKARAERWMRGEFEEGDLAYEEPDPRYRRFATTEQEIAGLRSVSAVHKVRMAEDVALRRYREFRQKEAKGYLARLIQELAEL